MHFEREPDGRYVLDIAGGHSYLRLIAISDRVGLQMTEVLRAQVMRGCVERIPDVVATHLLTRESAS